MLVLAVIVVVVVVVVVVVPVGQVLSAFIWIALIELRSEVARRDMIMANLEAPLSPTHPRRASKWSVAPHCLLESVNKYLPGGARRAATGGVGPNLRAKVE